MPLILNMLKIQIKSLAVEKCNLFSQLMDDVNRRFWLPKVAKACGS